MPAQGGLTPQPSAQAGFTFGRRAGLTPAITRPSLRLRREVYPITTDRSRGVRAFKCDVKRLRWIIGVELDCLIDRAVLRRAVDLLDCVRCKPDRITIGRLTTGKGGVQRRRGALHGRGWFDAETLERQLGELRACALPVRLVLRCAEIEANDRAENANKRGQDLLAKGETFLDRFRSPGRRCNIDDQDEGDTHRTHSDKESNQAACRLSVGKLRQQGPVKSLG
jgi:hypothetical protein